jgi:hypothetical protein
MQILIYNTCGISRNNTDFYLYALNNLLAQKFDNYRVVLSACLNSQECIDRIYKEFGNSINYNIINERLPISVTFNHSAQQMVKRYPDAESISYIDSGILFRDDLVLQRLYDVFKSGNYGLVSSRVTNDSGYNLWFGVGNHHTDASQDYLLFEKNWADTNGYQLDKNGNFIIPVGKCVNLHVNMFSRKVFDAYNGKLLTDVLSSFCVEATMSFTIAAVKQQWVIAKDVICDHATNLDIAASGFGAKHDLMFRTPKTIMEIIEPGMKFGMGFDSTRGLGIHDSKCFDGNYLCVNDELKDYIRDNLFLSKEYMDYDTVRHQFI